ncbi:hypothetical protein [Bradyrhizobium erythrophlei]|uniref:Uncharacterized protein n=1 Tax=Bradyrhizobium erythrophlei TaxID=1437360 RepID=A0A1M5VA32_9BRAD|nr:hypothetical protein [Bradyrhizobium erythrophlei]SHH72090.1 hypothetical protein SAMN05443248_5857 [Bradyrhizobium erythrophlei]
MANKTREARDLLSEFKVLRTESKADAVKILAAISQDIGPIDFLERIWVQEAAFYTWDTMRYRRVKTGILDNALTKALERILNRVKFPGPLSMNGKLHLEDRKASEILAHEWLNDPEGRRRVLSLLEEAGFDESAIEAEAYTMVAKDLENADRMLKAAQEGRDKALRSLAKYRKSLAAHVRRNSDRVLAADEAPSIANVPVN